MCAGDLCAAHGARMLPLLDTGGMTQPGKSLLAQLLLKAGSNDKKFVIEEAQHALDTIALSMDAPAILGRLLPYAAHKNPKVCKSHSRLHMQHDSAVWSCMLSGNSCKDVLPVFMSIIVVTIKVLRVLFDISVGPGSICKVRCGQGMAMLYPELMQHRRCVQCLPGTSHNRKVLGSNLPPT